MADENVTDTEVETEDGEESPLIRQLRGQLKAKDKELKASSEQLSELQGFQRSSVFKEAGFDPSTGVGKLFANQYDGELTVEAVKAAAEAEGITPTAAEQPTVDPQQQQRIAAGNTADQLLATSQTPSPPPDIDQRIAEAESKGDWAGSMVLKAQRAQAQV